MITGSNYPISVQFPLKHITRADRWTFFSSFNDSAQKKTGGRCIRGEIRVFWMDIVKRNSVVPSEEEILLIEEMSFENGETTDAF